MEVQDIQNIIDRIQRITRDEENDSAIRSGINILDRILGGGFSKGLYVLAGREAVGKTAFVVSLISGIIDRRTDTPKVGIISLDLSEQLWMERVLSNISEVWLEKISRGRVDEHELQKISDISHGTEFDRIEIAAPGYMAIQQLVATCTSWVAEKAVRIIFIDYLQLITYEHSTDPELKYFKIVQALKKLAIDLDVTIIVTVKLGSGKTTALPNLKDLRKIGAIETFADVIMFLYHPGYRQQVINQNEDMYISIAKNAFGLLDIIKLRALFRIQKFIEIDYSRR